MRRRLTPWRDLLPRGRWFPRRLAGLLAGGLLPLLVALAFLPSLRGHVTAPRTGKLVLRATVIDGDTLAADGDRFRLEGIDAPEMDQRCERDGASYACGVVARHELARLLGAGALECEPHGEDRYRRKLVRCWNGAGQDIGAAMVAAGWALAYRQYSDAYLREEIAARSRRNGLWAGRFDPPWAWRRNH